MVECYLDDLLWLKARQDDLHVGVLAVELVRGGTALNVHQLAKDGTELMLILDGVRILRWRDGEVQKHLHDQVADDIELNLVVYCQVTAGCMAKVRAIVSVGGGTGAGACACACAGACAVAVRGCGVRVRVRVH